MNERNESFAPEGRGKREEGRGKREEGRGKREEGRGVHPSREVF